MLITASVNFTTPSRYCKIFFFFFNKIVTTYSRKKKRESWQANVAAYVTGVQNCGFDHVYQDNCWKYQRESNNKYKDCDNQIESGIFHQLEKIMQKNLN